MLFCDGRISTIEELMEYESSILEVAGTEGIDLTIKLGLAQEELTVDLLTFLAGRDGVALTSVAVTEPLHKWHTFQALALIFRDAYHKQLNDRYLGKWQEYQRMARWAMESLLHTGMGFVSDPIAKAAAPRTGVAAGSRGAAVYFAQVAWVNAAGAEGMPSELAVQEILTNGLLTVTAITPPANAVSWNVYVGTSPDMLTRQNTAPLAPGETWVEPESGVTTTGAAPGTGQGPDWYLRTGRVLHRG